MNVEGDTDYYYYKEPKPQKPGDGQCPVHLLFLLYY